MIVKTSIGFLNSDSDAQLVVDVQSALTGMTDNANFATPSPTLAMLTDALGAFTVALAAAANGGTELTSIKNAKRAELVSLMRLLASYVTVTCHGDMTKMLSSGFIYQKPTRTRIGQLPASNAPGLKQGGVSGQLNASIPPVYGASSYNWSVALASEPDKSVQTQQTPGGRASFEDLTPGEDYSVKVNAVGAAGTSDWSDAATLIVI